jgi:hypothetical protein
MKLLSHGVKEKTEKGEEAYKNRKDGIKDSLSTEAFGDLKIYPCKKKCSREHGPYFDEGDGFCTRSFCCNNKRVFNTTEDVISKSNKEKHEEHGNQFS